MAIHLFVAALLVLTLVALVVGNVVLATLTTLGALAPALALLVHEDG